MSWLSENIVKQANVFERDFAYKIPPPSNVSRRMYDFYVLTGLWMYVSKVRDKLKYNPDDWMSLIDRHYEDYPHILGNIDTERGELLWNLCDNIDSATMSLVKNMRQVYVDDLRFSFSAEMRHVFDGHASVPHANPSLLLPAYKSIDDWMENIPKRIAALRADVKNTGPYSENAQKIHSLEQLLLSTPADETALRKVLQSTL